MLKLGVCTALFVTQLFIGTIAHAMDVPSMAFYNLSWENMITPEVHEGVIMGTRGNHIFLLNEKPYLILQETEIDGIPADESTFQLRKGTKVRVTSYRLRDKSYFAADVSIIH